MGGKKKHRPSKKVGAVKSVDHADGHPNVRVLTQPEVLEKLGRVMVFNVVVNREGTRDIFTSDGGRIDFYADAAEAKAALESAQKAHPEQTIELEAVPLGKAFAIIQGLMGIKAPMPTKLHFKSATVAEVGNAGVPEELRERMQSVGPFPLFYAEELKSPGASPFFLSRDDFRACWLRSGRALEALPSLEDSVTDLRILVASALTAIDDWQHLLLMPPKSTIELTKAIATRREHEEVRTNIKTALNIVDAEIAAERVPLAAHADEAPPELE